MSSAFLFELPNAPAGGYLREYTLTGAEEGLFVLCRDGKTYGKIIFDKLEIDAGADDSDGKCYRDLGKSFSYLYQPDGTRNLALSNQDLDLEQFLLNGALE